jgi:hypothetical protein
MLRSIMPSATTGTGLVTAGSLECRVRACVFIIIIIRNIHMKGIRRASENRLKMGNSHDL